MWEKSKISSLVPLSAEIAEIAVFPFLKPCLKSASISVALTFLILLVLTLQFPVLLRIPPKRVVPTQGAMSSLLWVRTISAC